MVDAHDSKSCSERGGGSSPLSGTMKGQIEYALPRKEWDRVSIFENNEPLVEVKETGKLRTGLIEKSYHASFLVRRSVAEKLYKAAEALPQEFRLVLIEGYRTLKAQQASWDEKFEKLKTEHPNWTEAEIEAQVRLVVAKPSPLANHHCGGAVDVTLAYADGTLVDMGTPYPSEAMSAEWYPKFKMLSDEITEIQKLNREILRTAMEEEDFVWYPGEWWHYCWATGCGRSTVIKTGVFTAPLKYKKLRLPSQLFSFSFDCFLLRNRPADGVACDGRCFAPQKRA